MRSRWWHGCVVAALVTAFGTCPVAYAQDGAQRGKQAALEQAAEALRAAQAVKTALHPAHSAIPADAYTTGTSHVWHGRTVPPTPEQVIARIPFSSATGQSAGNYFDEYISPIVQDQCVNCHVDGGASGETRLVFVAGSGAGHRQRNQQTVADFLGLVEDGAELLLNKVQGVSHGGGIQLAAGSTEFGHMSTWLGLLGEELVAATVTPETLFDSVRKVSLEATLRRAALLFAGRNPTPAELDALATGQVGIRRAIRNLMQGPSFHDFLVRAANDRLLTDKHVYYLLDPNAEYFVRLAQLMYEGRQRYGNAFYGSRWFQAVQYGVARAPLELIAPRRGAGTALHGDTDGRLHHGQSLCSRYLRPSHRKDLQGHRRSFRVPAHRYRRLLRPAPVQGHAVQSGVRPARRLLRQLADGHPTRRNPQHERLPAPLSEHGNEPQSRAGALDLLPLPGTRRRKVRRADDGPDRPCRHGQSHHAQRRLHGLPCRSRSGGGRVPELRQRGLLPHELRRHGLPRRVLQGTAGRFGFALCRRRHLVSRHALARFRRPSRSGCRLELALAGRADRGG